MSTTARQFDVIVLGAGAAGLMCAATAAARGKRVAVLDHNGQPGRKILISGGGRCNFTNLHCAAANYLSQNKHFVKSALAQFSPRHFLELVARYHIRWHEKTLGQLFCDQSARQILDLLLAECERGGVELVLNAGRIEVESGFRVASTQGEFHAPALVIATGGLSIPKLGATSLGYDVARQFGLNLVATRPALVPLLLAGEEAPWTQLAGVATDVEVRAAKSSFREKLLVTHRGLSGPAILQASSYWHKGKPLTVDFAPDSRQLFASLLAPRARRDAAAFRQALREALPQRLAGFLAEAALPSSWSNGALEEAERRLHNWAFRPAGDEGYDKAEVTAGGVDTAELDSKTLAARAVPGLFFIGEVVDVTGWLGGYNFQWAWSSAVAAGRAL
ncbi:NAD(P)/FAD-dependent oxidoreductase [Telmatobacter bradus]|uniref:NAD(P)/FAD-dependent oxidoreductase n=1 Tax=Telmatobacter bradus TaxID=474953 RepID=UPI003B435402